MATDSDPLGTIESRCAGAVQKKEAMECAAAQPGAQAQAEAHRAERAGALQTQQQTGTYPRTDEGYMALKTWWWNSPDGPHERGLDDRPADTARLLMEHLSVDEPALAEYVAAARDHARTFSWEEGRLRYTFCPFYQAALHAIAEHLGRPATDRGGAHDIKWVTETLQRTLSDDFGMDVDAEDGDEPGDFHLLERLDSACICQFNDTLNREFPEARLTPRAVFDNPTLGALAERIQAGPGPSDLLAPGTQPGDVADLNLKGPLNTPWPKLTAPAAPFTQLVGRAPPLDHGQNLYSPVRPGSLSQATEHTGVFRRATDGMQAVMIPGAAATIGDSNTRPLSRALKNEQPCHTVPLSTFLIDIEPVSVGAFARFLNLVEPSVEEQLAWFLPASKDPRVSDCPLQLTDAEGWSPKPEVSPSWPMILVSWHGANAYSLWANGGDPRRYKDAAAGFLPSEAQWEYAARGSKPMNYPFVSRGANNRSSAFALPRM